MFKGLLHVSFFDVVKKRFLRKSTFEHKATKSGHKLPNREKRWAKARFLGFLIKVLLSFYRGGVDSAFQRYRSRFTSFNNENKVENKFPGFSSEIYVSLRTSSAVFGNLMKWSGIVGNGRKQSPPGNWEISIFSGQKPCTRIIWTISLPFFGISQGL